MNYLTIDIETTGIDTLQDVPIQLAWDARDAFGKQRHNGFFLINNKCEISSFIQNLTGISQETIETKGISPREAAINYTKLVWKLHPVALIGYNLINFDFPMLQNFLARNIQGRFKFPPVNEIYDVMFLYQRFRNITNWPKLQDAAKSLKIEYKEEDLHDALEDVRLTWEVFSRVKEAMNVTF